MYFIGSGDATVCVVPGQPIKLHEGDFFGEMALLSIAVIGMPWSPTRFAASMCWTARGWPA
jgi:hypothetical protein